MAADNFKPTLWEGALLANFHSVSIADVLATKPAEIKGQKVIFNRVAGGTLKDYSGSVDWDDIDTTPVEMVFDKKKYFAFALDDVDKVQLKADLLSATTKEHAAVLAETYDVVSSLSDIKKSADGTREGIAILNGTPCEVKVNKDGTIANLRAIDEEANNATRARTLSITLATNAITSGINAAISAAQGYSHYNGLDNVPYDGYQAVLHKGERVLTAEENKAYSNDPGIDYNKMEKCMKSAVRELTLSVGSRELGRIIDEHLRERGIL